MVGHATHLGYVSKATALRAANYAIHHRTGEVELSISWGSSPHSLPDDIARSGVFRTYDHGRLQELLRHAVDLTCGPSFQGQSSHPRPSTARVDLQGVAQTRKLARYGLVH